MTSGKQASRRANRTIEANDNERDFGLVLAMSARRRQASQAGKMWAIYSQSHARFYMAFQQFQRPGQRNKILAEYGKEPIFTPHDPVPAKRRTPKQKRKPTTKR